MYDFCFEDSSRRYEKLYGMLLDAIPSSVLLIDPNQRIISANRNFLEKSRRSISNTVNYRLEEVFPSVILEQMNIPNRIRQVFEKNKPTRGERMIYRAPGIPMRVYYYKLLPFSWQGIVESVMFLMDDITEQVMLSKEVRLIERRLADVVESARDMVLSTDVDGRILTWNTAAEKISGYLLNEVKDRYFYEYFAAEHRAQVKGIFSNGKIGQKSKMVEWELPTKEGKNLLVSWVCSPMKDDQGKIVGICAVGRDLSERRKLEAQLLQSQKLAALGVMAGGIAHEIRNPLAVSSSAAQFLMEDQITPEFRKECSLKIYAGIKRVSTIIENLLRFARPSAKTEMKQLNLSSIIQETLMLISNQAKIQKIKLNSHLPNDPVLIRGISSLLQQVFMNLFLNAINSMPEGGTLGVSLGTRDGEVITRVTDSGYGISSEDLDKIFDPFFTTEPVGKGTGLGLSICYSIMKQHCGVIEVNSRKGKGSTFVLRFPGL